MYFNEPDLKYESCCVYLVEVGRAVHDSVCWGLKVLRGLGRDRDWCVGRGEGRIRGRSLLQAAGAGGGIPPPHHPHHLVQKTIQHKLVFLISTFLIRIGIAWPSLLTFHIVIIVAHVCVLCEQGGACRGGDASTDPLYAHLLLQTPDPAGTLETDVNHLVKNLECNQET